MSVGAALIALGIQSGALQMGADVIATTFSDKVTASAFGSAAGSALGALPSFVLGNIGLAAAGSAIAVPAVLLIGGGALILGLAGYAVGELIEQFLHPIPALADIATSASLALVGVALLIDGARRVTKDRAVRRLAASFADGAVKLARVHSTSFIDSLAGLRAYFDKEMAPFVAELTTNPSTAAAAAALAAVGVLGGQAVAAGSVTLLGSSSVGALGLSLGLVSAPLWPLIAGGGIALTVAYGVWRVVRQREGANGSSQF